MANENLISYDLTAAKKNALLKMLTDARDALPVKISLSPERRQTLPKMGDNTLPFVEKGLGYMTSNPEFTPPYIDLAELGRDFGVSSGYLELLRVALQIVDALTDVATEAGSEAFIAVLAYYQSVKRAAKLNVPGAKPIYEDLRKRFPGNPGGGGGATPPAK